MDSITNDSMSACMQDYWYLWTFITLSIVFITVVDIIIAYCCIKKYLMAAKILPRGTHVSANKPAPPTTPNNNEQFSSIPSSAKSIASRQSPAMSHTSSTYPLTPGSGNHRSSPSCPR